jgi:two-component system, NtrC family, nitrogen regulation sensor histidine kinase NtrY
MKFERQIIVGSLLSGLGSSTALLILLWMSGLTSVLKAILTGLILLPWLGFTWGLKAKLVFSVRTLSNFLGALRESDYSMRARGSCRGDALGEAIWEANALAELMREQRLGAFEATGLLRQVMGQIDVAMFGFDNNQRLQLINEKGRQLLGRGPEKSMGCTISELGLAHCLEGPTPRIMDLALPGALGRWELRRGNYRDKGVSHQLLFLSDLTRTLHEEERLAWKRLIQILRHEIGNSLTPIQSVAGSLQTLIQRQPRPDDWEEDLSKGLEIVGERSEALHRFIKSYSKLTRLPEPQVADVDVSPLVRHVAELETRIPVSIVAGPEQVVQADHDQLEQLLINIVTNAVEAGLESQPDGSGQVLMGWQVNDTGLQIWVEDNGPGLSQDNDVFVPFFTTKPQGSGIGLALSRQIAEAHGGLLTLENRVDGSGCRACLTLPLP